MRKEINKNRILMPLLKEERLRDKLTDIEKDVIEIVLSAYRTLRNPRGYAYLSMPLTSGKRLYDVLDNHGVKSIGEISNKILHKEVLEPNIKINTKIADEIADKTRKTLIAPAIFQAKKHGWSQKAYIYLWYRVLEEFIDETLMTYGWEYSNGGVQEFVRAYEYKFNFVLMPTEVYSKLPSYMPRGFIPTYKNWGGDRFPIQYEDTMDIKNRYLKEITLHDGAKAVASAIHDLKKRGFNPKKLIQSLFEIGGMAECHEYYKNGWLNYEIDMPWTIDYNSIYDSIRLVNPKFKSCSEYSKK